MKKENKVEITNNDTGLKLDYDDISPFTGNKCVLIESDTGTGMESRICMETGYTTTDRFTIGGKAIEQYEKFVPQLYKDTKFLDKTLNQIWYLSTMRTHVCCLYAEGTSKTDYKWKLAMVRSLDIEEKKNFPVEGKQDEYHTHIVDVDNAEEFDRTNFKGAMDKFYATMGETPK